MGPLLGGGSPLDIRAVMGNIQIRKMDPASIARLKASQKEFWRNWGGISSQRDGARQQMQNLQRAIEMQRAAMQKQLQELNREVVERAHEQVEYIGGEQ